MPVIGKLKKLNYMESTLLLKHYKEVEFYTESGVNGENLSYTFTLYAGCTPLSYTCLHRPTNKEFEKTIYGLSERSLQSLISKWNKSNPSTWAYKLR